MEELMAAAARYYIITVIAGCIVFGALLKSVVAIVTAGSRERTRREIAAYIAEGSMTPEQGERLMKADMGSIANRP